MSTHAERQEGSLPVEPSPPFIDVMDPARSGPKVDPLTFEKRVIRALETLDKRVARNELVIKYLEHTFASIPTAEYQGDYPKPLKERMQYHGVVAIPSVQEDIQAIRELLKIPQGTINVINQ